MKNLFNNLSQEEKNRILEMHSGKKNVISEQPEHYPGENKYRADEKNKINSAKQNCQKQVNLSSNDINIANFLITQFELYYAPIEGYGNVNDEETVKQLLKISNKQSYDKINQFLYCVAMSSPHNKYSKTFSVGEDIIKHLLKDFLTGLSGITDGGLRDMINNHLKKIGVKVSIDMF
jgi:hypothetical protein